MKTYHKLLGGGSDGFWWFTSVVLVMGGMGMNQETHVELYFKQKTTL